ncbi:MAG: hypothetical protein RDV48_12670 [Candidatus Eremiobacteraeota bacterium]|nr:hypothetical protein [Candidatus Eremiobacteraeota bacterium]
MQIGDRSLTGTPPGKPLSGGALFQGVKELPVPPPPQDALELSSASLPGISPKKPLKSPRKLEENSPELAAMKSSVDSVTARYTTKSSLDMEGYMIPANEGTIKHMCLTYSGHDSKAYFEAMKTFMSAMPSAKFTVLTHHSVDVDDVKERIQEWADKGEIVNPERAQVINSEQTLSIWAQDSTLVVGNKVIRQDREWFPGWGDMMVPELIAKNNPEVQYERMEGRQVDGGNQLATRDALFIGSDAIAFMVENMKKCPEKYETIASDLKIKNAATMEKADLAKLMLDRTFPRQKVVIIGYKGKQPSFHIDMTMTPLGKRDPDSGKPVVTLGDPGMALDILKDIKTKDPVKFRKYGRDLLTKLGWGTDFLTKFLEKLFPRFLEKIGLTDRNPLDRLMKELEGDKKLQKSLEAIGKGLEKDGYKVERVPYLGSSDLNDVPWITYNNGVIDGDRIFIPSFGLPELDGAAQDVYRHYGYEPIPIDMTKISSLKGAINCITKVIEREYTV